MAAHRRVRRALQHTGSRADLSDEPGEYKRSRVGEMLRCAWHGWGFDMRTGQSYFDPERMRVRSYPVEIEAGEALVEGPNLAETFPVTVEESYVLIAV